MQKFKNLLLVVLILLAFIGIILFFTSILLIAGIIFQSTPAGNSFLENVARWFLNNPHLFLVVPASSFLLFYFLESPFKKLLKRNKIQEKIENFF